MNTQLFLSITSGIFIGGISAYLGTLMLSKKMSIVAGPLAHLALPGVALAILYHFSISLGIFPFVILGAIIIWLLEKKTKLPLENLSAIIFAIGVGSALLVLPLGRAEEALIGSIQTITLIQTLSIIVLSTIIFFIIKKVYSQIMLINIHEDLARIEGVKIDYLNLLYLLSIAFVVGLGVYLVGGLITAALIAIPAATGKNISHDLPGYIKWSVGIGIFNTILGILLAPCLHLPIGPSIIVWSAIIFLVSVIFSKKLY